MSQQRKDGRLADALRPVSIDIDIQRAASGSALIRWGHTHVLCAASFDDSVPQHRQGKGGWLTAEYTMLPGATRPRFKRERAKVGGRTTEIQRLIGRSLRAAVDLDRLGPRTLYIDCDVLQADGGTRCASITGAWVAAALAIARDGEPRTCPLPRPLAAVSLGVVGGEVLLDLDYSEDSRADVDLNFVARDDGIVEVQGTAERRPFDADTLLRMTHLATQASQQLCEIQAAVLEAAGV